MREPQRHSLSAGTSAWPPLCGCGAWNRCDLFSASCRRCWSRVCPEPENKEELLRKHSTVSPLHDTMHTHQYLWSIFGAWFNFYGWQFRDPGRLTGPFWFSTTQPVSTLNNNNNNNKLQAHLSLSWRTHLFWSPSFYCSSCFMFFSFCQLGSC